MLVLVEVADGVATVTLNRPEARNALSRELNRELAGAITRLDADEDVRCLILTGADPAFCAGVDLKELSTEDRSTQQARQSAPASHFGMLPPHETPIIGAVNGPAVTGGFEVALGCDFLIASERARFADTHARVGVMPGGGLTVRLPRLIGVDRARRMSFTGDYIDAATALLWGLVVEVVPHEALLPRARDIAAAVSSIPTGERPRNPAHVRGRRRTVGTRGLAGRVGLVEEVDQRTLRPVAPGRRTRAHHGPRPRPEHRVGSPAGREGLRGHGPALQPARGDRARPTGRAARLRRHPRGRDRARLHGRGAAGGGAPERLTVRTSVALGLHAQPHPGGLRGLGSLQIQRGAVPARLGHTNPTEHRRPLRGALR